MTPATAPSSAKATPSDRSVFGLGETLLNMALSVAIPISAVVFVALTF